MTIRIAFTGHRNRTTTPESLLAVAGKYPGAIWVHGGAKGFDAQIEDFARANNITTIVIRPDYAAYGKGAPLKRNESIVRGSNCLIACYDGRESGGTVYTINLAHKYNIPVILLRPI